MPIILLAPQPVNVQASLSVSFTEGWSLATEIYFEPAINADALFITPEIESSVYVQAYITANLEKPFSASFEGATGLVLDESFDTNLSGWASFPSLGLTFPVPEIKASLSFPLSGAFEIPEAELSGTTGPVLFSSFEPAAVAGDIRAAWAIGAGIFKSTASGYGFLAHGSVVDSFFAGQPDLAAFTTTPCELSAFFEFSAKVYGTGRKADTQTLILVETIYPPSLSGVAELLQTPVLDSSLAEPVLSAFSSMDGDELKLVAPMPKDHYVYINDLL